MLAVVVSDFVLLNGILLCGVWSEEWGVKMGGMRQLFVLSNIALLISEWWFHAEIHERFSSAGEVVKKVVQLTAVQALLAYALMRHVLYWMKAGELVLMVGTIFVVLLLILRYIERNIIKRMRRMGMNTRTVTLVGDDRELQNIQEMLINDPTMGYRICGVWSEDSWTSQAAKPSGGVNPSTGSGTVEKLCSMIKQGCAPALGDEMYVCLSRKEKDVIRLLSRECDRQVT